MAFPIIATQITPITSTKGEGFYVELFLRCAFPLLRFHICFATLQLDDHHTVAPTKKFENVELPKVGNKISCTVYSFQLDVIHKCNAMLLLFAVLQSFVLLLQSHTSFTGEKQQLQLHQICKCNNACLPCVQDPSFFGLTEISHTGKSLDCGGEKFLSSKLLGTKLN